MDVPETLPARLYLLAYRADKQRPGSCSELGLILRAAALTELFHAGHLATEGKLVVATGRGRVTDPLQAAVLAEVTASRRARRWTHWVGRRANKFPGLVRDQLAADGYIRVESYRLLGLFPKHRVTLRDPRLHRRLADAFWRAVRGGEPVARIDWRDAAAAALANAGEMSVLIGRKERRQYKRRIEALGTEVEPVASALRRALRTQQAAHASAAGG